MSQVSFDVALSSNKLVGTPIEEVTQLAPYVGRLLSLGYVTLEHLLFGMEVMGKRLGSLLGTDLVQLISSIEIAPTAIPPGELEALSAAQYQLGVDIQSMSPPDDVPEGTFPSPERLIPSVNLIPQMPPVRNQGDRGTCVAHAALGAFEHFGTRNASSQDMSEQFCYWSCKQNDGRPNRPGTLLRVAVPLLHRDGCCTEATWPYDPAPKANDEAHGPPPEDAQIEALDHRIEAFKQLIPTAVSDLKAELAAGHAVAFSIKCYPSWYGNKWVRYTGDVVLPIPDEVWIGGHAMCLVGYVDLPDKPELGGGKFLIRNSWGESWGSHCPYGRGYGTIPYSFISRECLEAYSIH